MTAAAAALLVLLGAAALRTAAVAGRRAAVRKRLPDRREALSNRLGRLRHQHWTRPLERWAGVVLGARRRRSRARAERALPAMLEGIARSMRSGASLRLALEDAATDASSPLAPDLRRLVSEIRYGVSVSVALESLAKRLPVPGVVLAASALCLGTEAGGSQARALDGVAATLRERLAVADETRALAAQAQLSALVIGLAPLGFGLFAAATDPRTAHFLLRTAPGLAFLGAGLILDGLGWAWMRRICRAPA